MLHNPEPITLDFLLAQVSRLHRHRARELLHTLGLHRGQPPVLIALHEQDGLTHSELAEHLGITRATTTKMIQRMERSGFLKREPDANDRRVSRVYLTRAGHSVYADLESFQQQMDTESFRGFSEEEREVLHRFLLRIRENLAQAIQEKLPF